MSAPILIGQFQPGSDEWLAARRHGLGGSEIAAVVGLSPFESRFSLYHRKTGAVGPAEVSPPMEWGTRLEGAVLAKYRENHPELDFTVTNGTFAHPDRPWQIANPDLLAIDRIIEAKTSPYGDGWGDPGTDQIPVHVRCQVLWYMDVLDRERADVCVLISGCDYREYVVEWEPREAAQLREAGRIFLGEIACGVRPDIDEHSATYQAIKEMHPEIDPVDVDLTNAIARRFILAKAAEKAAKADAQHATSLVADHMGTARRALWDGQVIATRQARGDGHPYVVAAKRLPDLSQTGAAA